MAGIVDLINKVFYYTIDAPVSSVRGFIERRHEKREPFYYYHRRYRRVPTIDECLEDDYVCIYEADQQYLRDQKVEKLIIKLLQQELSDCYNTEGVNATQLCQKELEAFEEASDNYETKYADIGYNKSSFRVLLKQKSRMLKERQQQQQAEAS